MLIVLYVTMLFHISLRHPCFFILYHGLQSSLSKRRGRVQFSCGYTSPVTGKRIERIVRCFSQILLVIAMTKRHELKSVRREDIAEQLN